jgi:hypothetical protein
MESKLDHRRVTLYSCLVLTLCGCATSSRAQQDVESYKNSTGCTGAPLEDCMKNMRPYMDNDQIRMALKSIADNNTPDVNGKIGSNRRRLFISINLDGKIYSPLSLVEIDYSDRGLVNLISIRLPWSPSLAETEAQYDRTRIYEATALAVGAKCSALKDRGDFYRFIHNQVKQPQRIEKDREKYSSKTTYLSEGRWVGICGVSMMYDTFSENNSRIHSVKNLNRISSSSIINFKQ